MFSPKRRVPPAGAHLTEWDVRAIERDCYYDQIEAPECSWKEVAAEYPLDIVFRLELYREIRKCKQRVKQIEALEKLQNRSYAFLKAKEEEWEQTLREGWKLQVASNNRPKRLNNKRRCSEYSEEQWEKRVRFFAALDEMHGYVLFMNCMRERYPAYNLEDHPRGRKFADLYRECLRQYKKLEEKFSHVPHALANK